jgi:hypothetical protein
MLISPSAKFVFVHIQKTAGLSIEAVLRQHFNDARFWHGRHGHASDGIAEIGMDKWRQNYSFAFVRNPWDRLVSWYAMIDRERQTLPWYSRWRKAPFQTLLWNEVVQKASSFEEFIERCDDVIFDRGSRKSFAFNQIDYISAPDGRLAVDFVGRFESLAADFGVVAQRLGLGDVTLPKRNVSRHAHYSSWYNDRTHDIVAKRFARDIAAFGYEFETPVPSAPSDRNTQDGSPASPERQVS